MRKYYLKFCYHVYGVGIEPKIISIEIDAQNDGNARTIMRDILSGFYNVNIRGIGNIIREYNVQLIDRRTGRQLT
jgi:hypothetical protein